MALNWTAVFGKTTAGVLVIGDVRGLFFSFLETLRGQSEPRPSQEKKKVCSVCSEWFWTDGLIKADGRRDQTGSHPGRISVLCNGRELKDCILPAPFEV